MQEKETEIYPEQPGPADYDFERAEQFYTRLRRRVARWLKHHTGIDGKVRDALLLLPDLLALVIRLIRDPRIALGQKAKLIAVSSYVLSPIDLVPDFLLPFGLIDDTVAMALVLRHLVGLMDEAGEAILHEHWEGSGDVLDRIRWVVENATAWFSSGALGRLRRILLGREGRKPREESG